MLSELGVDPLEFLKAGNESKFLRSAAAQKVLVDAAKYRIMMQAPRAVAARAALPPVQRPGVARSSSERNQASISELDQRLSRTGDIKDAMALYHAKKARG
jgi:hypothetical protein